MKIYKLLIVIIYGTGQFAFAQDSAAVMGLESCIRYAIKVNQDIKSAWLAEGIAEKEIGEFLSIGLPQISGVVSASNNFEVQSQFLPDFISPSVYGVLIQEGLYNGPIPEPDIFAAQFGTQYTASAYIQARQLILDGSYFVGLKASRTYKQLATKEAVRTEINVIEAVSKAYYSALISDDFYDLVKANFDRLDTLLRETTIMYENGFVEKIDVDRVKVSYNNVKVELQKSERNKELTYDLLKFQMGMPISQELQIEGNMQDTQVPNFDFEKDQFSIQKRVEYEVLETNRDLATLDLKNYTAQYFPSLYAQFSYGYNMGSNEFSDITNFSDRYVAFGVIGLSLNIPIFDGFLKKNHIQKNRLQLAQIDYQFQKLENSIALEINQARSSFDNSLEVLEVQRENMNLAREVYDVTKIKYQQGLSSNSELIDGDRDYKEAQLNYYQALFEALVAKVDLEKALGMINKQRYAAE